MFTNDFNFNFDLTELVKDKTNAPRIINLMMFLNHAEKIAYLRKIHAEFWKSPKIRESELIKGADLSDTDAEKLREWRNGITLLSILARTPSAS